MQRKRKGKRGREEEKQRKWKAGLGQPCLAFRDQQSGSSRQPSRITLVVSNQSPTLYLPEGCPQTGPANSGTPDLFWDPWDLLAAWDTLGRLGCKKKSDWGKNKGAKVDARRANRPCSLFCAWA